MNELILGDYFSSFLSQRKQINNRALQIFLLFLTSFLLFSLPQRLHFAASSQTYLNAIEAIVSIQISSGYSLSPSLLVLFSQLLPMPRHNRVFWISALPWNAICFWNSKLFYFYFLCSLFGISVCCFMWLKYLRPLFWETRAKKETSSIYQMHSLVWHLSVTPQWLSLLCLGIAFLRI